MVFVRDSIPRRAVFLVVAAGTAMATTGCSKEEEPHLLRFRPVRTMAVDQVEEFELREGHSVLYGVRLPFVIKLRKRLPDGYEAAGRAALEDVENYLTDRIEAERVDRGPKKTVFVNVVAKEGEPAIDIALEQRSGNTYMFLTKRPGTREPTPGLSEAERWREVGLTPDGKLINKTTIK